MFHNPHGGFPRPNMLNQQPMVPVPQQPMAPMHPQQMIQQLMQQGYPPQQIMQMMMQQGYPQQQIMQMMQQLMPQPMQPMQPGYPQQYQQPMIQQHMQPNFSSNQQVPGFNQPQQGFGVPQVDNSARFGGNRPQSQPQTPQPVQQMQTPTPAPQQPNIAQQLTKLSKVKMVSTSFVVGTRTAPFTPDDIVFNDDTIAVVDCVEEAVEQIAELFNCDTTDKVVKNDYVIINKVFGLQSSLFEDNLSTKPKELSKTLKEFHSTVSNKSMLVYALSLNELFTSYVNDVLFVNTNGEINIDSFMDDYGDLCDALVGPNLHLGKEVNDKLELYLGDIKTAFSSFHVKQSLEAEGECPCNYTPLLDKVSLFYLDALNMELNLNVLPTGVITQVIGTESSRYSTNSLHTLIDSIYSTPLHLTSARNFIVTFDKSMYEVFSNSTGKYFIKAW